MPKFRLHLSSTLYLLALSMSVLWGVVFSVEAQTVTVGPKSRMTTNTPPQRVENMERKEAILAAHHAGLKKPYRIERVPAALLLKRFDVKALTAAERAELDKLAVRSPLCGRGDASPMEPCPVQAGMQFGLLRAKQGGCVWSPIYGVPATQNHQPFVSLAALRCGVGEEWDRIQKTALPRG